jgi:UDP-glucose 4-epimerase
LVETHLVTGGAGFVGVNLVDALTRRGIDVVVMDDLSLGQRGFLDRLGLQQRMRFLEVDLSDLDAYRAAVREEHIQRPVAEVWHLCANSDIPAGVTNPEVDLKNTFMTTFNTCVVMRELGIRRLNFSSTSAVYGDHGAEAITESFTTIPISNYGAMKLASEAQIYAAAETGFEKITVFRFPNVVGAPATHGVILDFVHKLKATPGRLDVRGNGTQRKAYLHVCDLVDAMLFVRDNALGKITTINIGPTDAGITVREIAEKVRDRVAPDAEIHYGSEDRGWVGDVPRFRFSIAKLVDLGWLPPRGSHEAIALAIEEIAAQEGV